MNEYSHGPCAAVSSETAAAESAHDDYGDQSHPAGRWQSKGGCRYPGHHLQIVSHERSVVGSAATVLSGNCAIIIGQIAPQAATPAGPAPAIGHAVAVAHG